ncbi:MAG: hypothetical protein WBX05_00990 [Pseudolabrys sp.]
MTSERRKLPTRRAHSVRSFAYEGRRYVAGLGYFPGGELGEIFLDVEGRVGSEVAEHAATTAILVSMLLQMGVKPSAISHSITGPVAWLLAHLDTERMP